MIELVHAGARGYVTKTIEPAELVDAVRRVADGDAVFSPRLAGFVLDAFAAGRASTRAGGSGAGQLTMREREVLHLIARGYLYKEVALELGISTKTVETHVSAVLRKLQLSNRHQLSRWAAERRLVRLGSERGLDLLHSRLFGSAPMIWWATCPCLKSSSVGIDMTLNCADTCGFSSTFSLTMRQVLALAGELLEMRGDDPARTTPGSPEVDQHGLVDSSTSAWKLLSVTSLIALPSSGSLSQSQSYTKYSVTRGDAAPAPSRPPPA